MTQQTQRSSAFELLRITAMIYLIVSLLQGNFEFKSLIEYMLPIVMKQY